MSFGKLRKRNMGKVISTIQAGTPKGTGFPKLMIGDKTGMVVLMTENKVGTVVNSGDNIDRKVGWYYNDWQMEHFTDFDGVVTLKNE